MSASVRGKAPLGYFCDTSGADGRFSVAKDRILRYIRQIDSVASVVPNNQDLSALWKVRIQQM
jgi:hypothetical protein